uniref:Uncharacterized protein n=1 Tax=Candidatus Kentrum sp. FW TaxID=2126338 RepID=A0A450TAK5_9GAMM|nr:MAG: hypothetical protein BECKFW1821C_GA0114237_100477 [Candidatus Kentron sp. FW]
MRIINPIYLDIDEEVYSEGNPGPGQDTECHGLFKYYGFALLWYQPRLTIWTS